MAAYPRQDAFVNLHITAGSSPAKKQHAYGIIREEIAFLKFLISQSEKEIAAWKQRYNSLCDIHRLPEEILAYIFQFLAHESQPPSAKWSSVTRVCSHWRQAALKHPEVWSRPDFHHLTSAREMIKRAKACPLTIDFTMHDAARPANYYPPRFKLISESLGTARTLCLRNCYCYAGNISASPISNVIEDSLERPAPLLESLTLNNPRYSLPRTLPERIFSGNSPRLRQVSLFNWTLPRTADSLTPFTQITSLKVILTSRDMRYPATETIRLLKHFPDLQDLQLSNVLGPIPMNMSYESAVGLPRLDQLVLIDSSAGCDLFFNMVDFPSSAQVEVGFIKSCLYTSYLDGRRWPDRPAERTVQNVGNRLPVPIRAVKIRESVHDFCFDLEAYTTTPWRHDNPQSQLNVNGVPPVPVLMERLSDILPLTNLSVFVYSLQLSFEELWRNIGQLPNLWSLGVHHNHESLLRVLGSPRELPGTDTRPDSHLYYPGLCILLLNKWKFWDESDRENENFDIIGPEWFPPPEDHVQLTQFKEALRFRREQNYQLTNITLTNSVFTPVHGWEMSAATGEQTQWMVIEQPEVLPGERTLYPFFIR